MDETPQTERPAALGAKVTLGNLDKVDAALAEISWIKARRQQIDAEVEQAYLSLCESFNDRVNLAIGKTKTTLADRLAYLTDLVQAWAEEHLAENLPADSKTLRLEHGTLALVADKPALELFEGWEDKDVLVAMDLQMEFVDDVRAVLDRPVGELTIGDFVRLIPEVNRIRLLELHKSEKITDEDLGPYGLQRRPPAEKVTVKPKAA